MGATRGRLRSRAWLAAAVAASVVAGCGGSTSGSGGAGTSATDQSKPVSLPALPPAGAVAWAACSAGSTFSCGTVSVPVDYRHPTLASIPLAVIRSPATDPSGPTRTLVFNPGGPGQSGTQIRPVTLGDFPPAVRQHFDIVSFDPRGTGASDPLRCGTPPSALTSVAPVPSGAGQPLPGAPAFTAMAQRCQQRTASLEPFLNTFNTARDMDRIRQALGLASIDFYGMSYGTVLGSVYADLFPRRVGTMVLDGAVDVNAPLIQQATQEAPAAERSLDHLLAGCAAQSTCPLGADPQAFFRSLASALIHRPLPPPGGGDPYPVTAGDLDTATLLVLSVPAFSSTFYAALVAANRGNGAPLRSLALLFVTDIDGSPLVDPLWAITCNDADAHPGPTEAGALARSIDARYPLIGAYAVTYTMGGCVSWPSALEPVADLHPRGTPPILVIGNTGDPNTPLINAQHLAAIFSDASLVTWRGWGHTWLLSGSADPCMQQLVTRYLTGAGQPRPPAVCG